MAKAKRKRGKRKASGGCKYETIKGYRRRVCRDSKGRIKSNKTVHKYRKHAKKRKTTHRRKARGAKSLMVCPKMFRGSRVHAHKGRCYIKRANGQWRFVRKVRL